MRMQQGGFLDPNRRALRADGCLQACPGRQATPALRFQGLAADRQAAGEHEEFQPAPIADRDGRAGCPVLQTDVLVAVVEQDGRARRSRPRFYSLALARLADDLCLIAITELPEPHEDGAAVLR